MRPVKHRALRALAGGVLALAAALSAHASEVRFSGMVTDLDTGLVLTASNVDKPRDARLMGRLMTLGLAIEMMERGADDELKPLASRVAASGPDRGAAISTLANRLGGTVSGFSSALSDFHDRTGLRSTALRVLRGANGSPVFSGYTTPRDLSRLTMTLLLRHQEAFEDIMPAVSIPDASPRRGLAENGVCLLVKNSIDTRRILIAVASGASDRVECFSRAEAMITRDEGRITRARIARDRRE